LTPRSPSVRRVPLAWALALVALFALRLPHLAGPLDDPHSWRQADTVYYTWDFWRHGLDVLHPRVCWLGGHGTLIFEFALPEAIAALLDRAFGYSVLWDRLVALAFTALWALWLHRLTRQIADAFTARAAVALALIAPLAQFFSRAPQVDFAAQAFAIGMLHHGLRALRGGGRGQAMAAAACGSLAALIKGPYLIPVFPPLALGALGAASFADLVAVAGAVATSAVAFVVWRAHVNAVNGAAPDWFFLSGYYKEVNPWWWYVGEWRQRLSAANWIRLFRRLALEISSPAGLLLGAAGALLARPAGDRAPGARAIALAWVAGTLLYVLVFFPLNVIHDYYQIPLVAPVALLSALGLRALTREGRLPAVRALAWLAFAGALALSLVAPRHQGYYRIDALRESAARAIDARVPEADLLLVVDHDSGYSDPRLLGRALRHGWALKAEEVTPAMVERLHALGARWLAWVSEPGVARLAPPAFLAGREVGGEALLDASHAGRGQPPLVLGTLHLYRLGDAPR